MKILTTSFLCSFIFLFCGASISFAQEIGANFNHEPQIIDLRYLKKTPVEWIRTTPYIFEYINGQKDPATEPGLGKIIDAKNAGYRVAFGFRWDFKKYHLRIPEPGSERETKYFDVVRALLSRVGGHIDMLKLGNEPNLETTAPDLQFSRAGYVPLVNFMERMLNNVVLPFYQSHPEYKKPDFYVGSLPALFERGQQQTPGVVELIKFAQRDKNLTGLSVHLHIADTLEIPRALNFVRSLMPSKPIIVPEFSMFRLYNKHVPDLIGATPEGKAFLRQYNYPDTMHIYEWYSLVNGQKVDAAQWEAFFKSQAWFQPHVLQTFYRYFQKYGVVLATYGFFSQAAPAHVRPGTAIWFINPIFPCKSLKTDVNGDCPANPLWFDDFTSIVNKGKITRKATHH